MESQRAPPHTDASALYGIAAVIYALVAVSALVILVWLIVILRISRHLFLRAKVAYRRQRFLRRPAANVAGGANGTGAAFFIVAPRAAAQTPQQAALVALQHTWPISPESAVSSIELEILPPLAGAARVVGSGEEALP
jgi:hypothetical protein